MQVKRFVVSVMALVVACSAGEAEQAPAPSVPAVSQPANVCPEGTKSCASTCVPLGEPATGCGASACEPCAAAHASATCAPSGQCALGECENGFGDCNASPADGCESDLRVTSAHCGACGVACAADQTCRAGACVARSVAEAEAWLATQASGYCLDGYNKIMNLCGDVEFCFDSRVMRTYPKGLSLDLGFVWNGTKPDTALLSVGGDCDGKRIGVSGDQLFGFGNLVQFPKLDVGKHLLGYRITSGGGAIYVDGLKIASVPPPTKPIELVGACGPGIVAGSRISYWWEANQEPNHQNLAVFLVHLRDEVTDADGYSVPTSTAPQPSTVFLFDSSGASGATWSARAGGLVGVGKNAKDGTPQLDAGASGPLPEWKPLAACAL